jgi:uncharacterized ubiquitin-like protein YukD
MALPIGFDIRAFNRVSETLDFPHWKMSVFCLGIALEIQVSSLITILFQNIRRTEKSEKIFLANKQNNTSQIKLLLKQNNTSQIKLLLKHRNKLSPNDCLIQN